MRITARVFAILSSSALLAAQSPADDHNPLLRQYREGEALVYSMKGLNESWQYTIQAEGIVKRDAAGTYIEEYRWTHLVSDGQVFALSPESQAFRQQLSLDPNSTRAIPDLSKVDPKLIGPALDFMTFYSDLWLAIKTGHLAHPGDHFYLKYGTPSSWADGSRVLVGETSIDFDLTLQSVNPSDHMAVLLVRHVPPEKPQVPLAAGWMQTPVTDTPNNWVQFVKVPGKYLASVGQETFTVELKVSLTDGKILRGSLDNSVKTIARTCNDKALTQCDTPQSHKIIRKIEISLAH